MKLADVDDCVGPDVTSGESAELRERNKTLEQAKYPLVRELAESVLVAVTCRVLRFSKAGVALMRIDVDHDLADPRSRVDPLRAGLPGIRHYHHRALGVVDDLTADSAEAQVRESAPASGAYDHQVGVCRGINEPSRDTRSAPTGRAQASSRAGLRLCRPIVDQLGQGARACDPGCHVLSQGPHLGLGVPAMRGKPQLSGWRAHGPCPVADGHRP
jgi:hypothetical protein